MRKMFSKEQIKKMIEENSTKLYSHRVTLTDSDETIHCCTIVNNCPESATTNFNNAIGYVVKNESEDGIYDLQILYDAQISDAVVIVFAYNGEVTIFDIDSISEDIVTPL